MWILETEIFHIHPHGLSPTEKDTNTTFVVSFCCTVYSTTLGPCHNSGSKHSGSTYVAFSASIAISVSTAGCFFSFLGLINFSPERELVQNFGVSTCRICNGILKFSSGCSAECLCWKPVKFWWLVPEKIAFCLQRSGTKYWYFIWAKCAVMVRSALRITLLLASFDVALPSEREKSSWID